VEIMARPGKPKSIPSPLAPAAPAAVPQPSEAPPTLVDSQEALAFRRAQAELRRTSRLPALNAAVPVTE
jgi:hypothetical protein